MRESRTGPVMLCDFFLRSLLILVSAATLVIVQVSYRHPRRPCWNWRTQARPCRHDLNDIGWFYFCGRLPRGGIASSSEGWPLRAEPYTGGVKTRVSGYRTEGGHNPNQLRIPGPTRLCSSPSFVTRLPHSPHSCSFHYGCYSDLKLQPS